MYSKTAIRIVTVSLAVSAGAVLIAAPAQAVLRLPDRPAQVWVQSFQRSGPDARCLAPADETPWNSAWTAADQQWQPSWSQWPSNGAGGWTCSRAITWDPGFTDGFLF
jgi:hypothetical protein